MHALASFKCSIYPQITKINRQIKNLANSIRSYILLQAHKSVSSKLDAKQDADRLAKVLDEIFTECDIENDGIFLSVEALACWEFIESNEYVLLMLLRDSNAMPKVYGTCGNLYAVEYADASPYIGCKTCLSDNRTWTYRANLAVAILELIENIEDTPYGTLHLCDVHEGNFGLVS